MNSARPHAFDAHGLCLGPAGTRGVRAHTEQRGATRLVICARGEGADGGRAAETAIRAICAARFIPAMCRQPSFWSDLLESIDTYLYSGGGGGECAIAVAAVIDGQVVGAGVGDIGVWLLDAGGTRELNPARDPDALAGSAIVEPDAFGPVPFAGVLLLADDGAVREAGLPALREHALAADSAARALDAIAALAALDGREAALALCRPA